MRSGTNVVRTYSARPVEASSATSRVTSPARSRTVNACRPGPDPRLGRIDLEDDVEHGPARYGGARALEERHTVAAAEPRRHEREREGDCRSRRSGRDELPRQTPAAA